jgi:hypothetical protein
MALFFPLICVVLLLNLATLGCLSLRYYLFRREERLHPRIAPMNLHAAARGRAKVIPIRGSRIC